MLSKRINNQLQYPSQVFAALILFFAASVFPSSLLAASVTFAQNVTFADVDSTEMFQSRTNWMTRVYRTTCESVVDIRGDKIDDVDTSRLGSGMGMGTGIIIDPRGYIVTNFHVVDGIRSIQVTTHAQKKFTATLITRDTDTDLAIIKIDAPQPLPPIKLGRSHNVETGEEVVAIGNPFGYASTMTNGIVSGVGREVEVNDTLLYRGVIQTNAAINPGNSGGPLMNIDGEMIGINAAIRQGAECIAFAIPVDQVAEVAAKMIGDLVAEQVHLGFRVKRDENSQKNRVVVASVEDAENSICAGDLIMSVDGKSVTLPLEFYCALLDRRSGEALNVRIERNTSETDLLCSLAAPRKRRATPSIMTTSPTIKIAANQPKISSNYPSENFAKNSPKNDPVWETLGVRVEPLSATDFQTQYAKFLSLYPLGGVRVQAVRGGGIFANEGIRAGDIIVGIHDWSTTSQDDLRYIVGEWQNLKPQGNIRVLIIRGTDGHFYRYVPVE